MENDYRYRSRRRREQELMEQNKKMEHRYCLLRWMTAGMLFLVLAVAFYFDFSYQGFDKEYVEHWLQNDTMWKQVTAQIYAGIQDLKP
ncbi:MAG: hypothetical protein K2J67_03570 [Lachnospiraceae bacterium]|nr:hypothetical protein [Lachnospiraceae bacterium]